MFDAVSRAGFPSTAVITWLGYDAPQRRSNGWNPGVDNAALKAEKVIKGFTAQ